MWNNPRCLISLLLIASILITVLTEVIAMVTSGHPGSSSNTLPSVGKLLIDTDAGADDAAAILLAIVKRNVDVVAITCTYGNTKIENVENNVLKTLTVANRTDIPVFSGAYRPLVGTEHFDNFFGEDGLGDFEFKDEITSTVNRGKHAVIAMLDMTKAYPGQISIMVLGPLTNMAMAIRLDPHFLSRVKHVYIMGGSVVGVGNARPNVEFNFAQDPESNFIVLNATRETPITLLPYDTAVWNAKIPKKWRTEDLGILDSPIMEFLNQAERKSLSSPSAYWPCADFLMAAVVLHPEIVQERTAQFVLPVVDGMAKGSLLVDYKNTTGNAANVEIINRVNSTAVQEYALESFK